MPEKIDYSAAAVTRRLRRVDELRELCLALAGPRLQWDWRWPSAEAQPVAREPKATYVPRRD